MNVAIIPARGGSKRIPRKNIKLFFGKPVIAYAIEAATLSGCFDRVIVSTDDQEIADVAKAYGAEVPYLRSKSSSTDHATLHDVVVEVLDSLKAFSLKNIALILPTSPLLRINTVQEVMSYLDSDEYDSALTVVEYETSPDKALSLASNGSIIRQNISLLVKRSQEHQTFYHDAGQIYAFRANEVLARKTLTGAQCRAVILDRMNCQDIDVPSDWVLAEMKFKLGRELE
ncbi:pseudaminic acid cytidylyltransferase [Vibrio navarrensis]|uniref:pseudaminic acid cytidylyltransferase n=1 Tax=Vibrio navarrensis TaxID=29495 RepID=UPI001869F687|nr:pseudaminic acid cytidylyltransferase [Vibrio navarrensis]EJK2116476.1 pseudaminic acid cytidylyltransferase [Vibrio navarrensis]MBE4575062.1 pseudaminic acid cytidylyltransferase [Vibrio navarrensis]MBE4590032.1 pseudaminic acid cytidylyltransferase [Vibrio navarrensis]